MLSFKWLLALSLILGAQNSVFAAYDYIDATSDVMFFFPAAPLVFIKAIQIWQQFKKVSQLWKSPTNSEKLDTVLSGMEKLSMDVYKIQESIQHQLMTLLPKEVDMDNKLNDIYEHSGKIDYLFHLFLLYSNSSQNHENETIRDFYHVLVDPSEIGMRAHLPEIHRLIMKVDYGTDVVATLADHEQSESLRCKREQSSLQLINNLYNNIILAEVKGIIMIHYAYNLHRQFNDTYSFRTELKEYIVDAWERVSLLIPKFKSYMEVADRDIWKCDPSRHVANLTYVKLSPIFTRLAINSARFGDGKFGDKERYGQIGYWYGWGGCEDRITGYSDSCAGWTRDCEDTKDLKVNACWAKPGSGKRYEYIELINSNKLYGSKQSKCPTKVEELRGSGGGFRPVELCWCTCEEKVTAGDHRYFSLRPVTSNLHKNKVITGVRIVLQNETVQLQVQQGELRENGNIAQRSVTWRQLHSIDPLDASFVAGKDYHNITWETRTVNIDSLEAPANSALTGLKFELEGNALKLAIQYTPIDFAKGKLFADRATWLSNPTGSSKDRTQIKFDAHLPLERRNLPMINNQKAFLNFTPSSIEADDLGYSVVPYIDAQAITSTPAVLLSGAGLVYKGAKKSAGFLTMKLQTYNYAKHLRVEPESSNALDKFLKDYDNGVYDRLFETSESNKTSGVLLLD